MKNKTKKNVSERERSDLKERERKREETSNEKNPCQLGRQAQVDFKGNYLFNKQKLNLDEQYTQLNNFMQ